jgi:hypothetical protein
LEYFESEKEVIYRKKILPPIISNSDQNLEWRHVPHKKVFYENRNASQHPDKKQRRELKQ